MFSKKPDGRIPARARSCLRPEGNEDDQPGSDLLRLPSELRLHVLSFFTPWELDDIPHHKQTCRTLAEACRDDVLWRAFGHPSWESRLLAEKQGWKEAYLTWLHTIVDQYGKHESELDSSFKVVIVGAPNVRKSALFKHSQHILSQPTTFQAVLGVNFSLFQVERHNKTIRFQLWDVSGHDRFQQLASAYNRRADVCFVVYDIRKRSSFAAAQHYSEDVERHNPKPDLVRVLVAMSDEEENTGRVVSEEEGRSFASTWGASYCACSTTGEGVDDALLGAIDNIACRWRNVPGLTSPVLFPDTAIIVALAARSSRVNKGDKKERCCLQ